eukprot:TRINITY_DN73459_c0_g1_i1.p1 TRINITY_DN73459_c0_g1~~TRINITY_DN73459_c0_g1_i1.p1  ORF type:complete len:297 (-),score=45.59 TRINITY_DN73459_c0_g1_i1:300-1106(-)
MWALVCCADVQLRPAPSSPLVPPAPAPGIAMPAATALPPAAAVFAPHADEEAKKPEDVLEAFRLARERKATEQPIMLGLQGGRAVMKERLMEDHRVKAFNRSMSTQSTATGDSSIDGRRTPPCQQSSATRRGSKDGHSPVNPERQTPQICGQQAKLRERRGLKSLSLEAVGTSLKSAVLEAKAQSAKLAAPAPMEARREPWQSETAAPRLVPRRRTLLERASSAFQSSSSAAACAAASVSGLRRSGTSSAARATSVTANAVTLGGARI